MKKIKYLLSLLLFLIIFSLVSKPQVVNADTGPKPSSFITIKGIEGDYVSCFASRKADGPNFTYQDYLEYGYDHPEYNPIMEYEDDEGYKWITNYYICKGESTISFTYFCPSEFKIVIYQNNELLIATEMLEMYAFSTYYEIDFSTGTITTPEDIKVTKTYDYSSEILNLILRIVLTLAIEIGVFYLFRLYTKHNLRVVIIVNLITQIFLNFAVNIKFFYSGIISAIFLLFIIEFFILIIEFIAYQFLLKDKKRYLISLYPLVANLLSFVLGFWIFIYI